MCVALSVPNNHHSKFNQCTAYAHTLSNVERFLQLLYQANLSFPLFPGSTWPEKAVRLSFKKK